MSEILENFNVETQYLKYLNKCGLKLDEMHPVQLTETKRAFYAACGQMLLLITQDMPNLTDEVAQEQVDFMMKQVVLFWEQERNTK